jgi:hypothetical protein
MPTNHTLSERTLTNLRLLIKIALRLQRNQRIWLCWTERGWKLL